MTYTCDSWKHSLPVWTTDLQKIECWCSCFLHQHAEATSIHVLLGKKSYGMYGKYKEMTYSESLKNKLKTSFFIPLIFCLLPNSDVNFNESITKCSVIEKKNMITRSRRSVYGGCTDVWGNIDIGVYRCTWV